MRATGLLALPLVLVLSGCVPTGWFDVDGSVTVPSVADELSLGKPCDDDAIDAEFSDIGEGTPVTVENQDGETIARGALEAGTVIDQGGETLLCSFPFTLTEVPETAFYSVLIGDGSRGGVQFTQPEMQNGPAIPIR